MEEKEGSDWKIRLANYEDVFKQMEEPTPQLISQLQSDLPKYLTDVNPNCLKVALSICESYFKSASSINYPQIARILIDKSFTTKKQSNADTATSLLLQCFKHSHDAVLENVFDELNSKSPRIVRAMISLLSAHLSSNGNADASKIVDSLTPLLDHRDQNIRKEASIVISFAKNGTLPPKLNDSNTSNVIRQKSPARQGSVSRIPEPVQRQRSPNHKRRFNPQSASSLWTTWISKATLALLSHSKWQSVVAGFDDLHNQYVDENGNPSACIYGLATVFLGRTFTPKVMNKLMTEILFYMKEDPPNITDDTIQAIVHFFIDKITDKRLETYLFEMADIVAELMTPSFVFTSLYPQLSAKNPMLPARICCYFSHSLQINGNDANLNPEEISEQIKSLCNHSDPNVRKSALDCVSTLTAIYGDTVLEGFKCLKPVQINEIKRTVSKNPQKSFSTQSKIPSPKKFSETSPNMEVLHRTSPKKQRTPPQRSENYSSSEEFIPTKLITSISKISNPAESHKALNDVSGILYRSLDLKGQSSMQQIEFVPLFNALTNWFKENNAAIAQEITTVLLYSFKLISPNDSHNISEVFLMDIFLLLNYPQKSIRKNVLEVLTLLNNMIADFIPNIFIPIFPKLGADGRKIAVMFLRGLNVKMNIQDFIPFIVNCMNDKNEDFKEASFPLIQSFLQLHGASDAVREFINDFPSSKKSIILDMLSPTKNKSYMQKPTQLKKDQREKKIDAYLPLKVMNGTENASSITKILEHYGIRFFNTSKFSSIETEDIKEISSMFLNMANSDFQAFSLTLDIIFLWWTQLSLLVKHQDSFDSIFVFLLDLCPILKEKQRKLNNFEVNVMLPTILECVGRRYQKCELIQPLIFDLSPYEYLLPTLVYILGNVTSVYAVQADINALSQLIPQLGWGNMSHELLKTASKIQEIISKTPDKNPDLTKSINSFVEFLKEKREIKSPSGEQKPVSRCSLSPKISSQLKSPAIVVYQWIVDLSSQDTQITIQALKSISQQLKTDPKVFEPHLEVLTIWLITSVHTYFASDPPTNRLCKYISFCLLTLFNETSLKDVISQSFVQQLVYEMLTHLSNGINEAVLNQVLNALIVKLIDDCTMYAFIGLLSAISEFDNRGQYTERWIRLALKCFEACGVRICEVKNDNDICESIYLVNKMLIKYSIQELESSPVGSKIIEIIRSYVKLVYERFSDVVNTKEMKKKLGSDSEVLKIVNDNGNH